MNTGFKFRKLIIATSIVAVLIIAFLVHALAGWNSHPVVYQEPPNFVQLFAEKLEKSAQRLPHNESGKENVVFDDPDTAKLAEDFSWEEALVFKVIMEQESQERLFPLFSHPDQQQRIKVASALAHVQIQFTHDEESGFPAKRNQFLENLGAHLPHIRNALSEALIASAQSGTSNRIPYTLAWLPERGRKTLELFEWAAKHHPDTRVRASSLYYVAKLGDGEEFTAPLLRNRAHDPDFRVRQLALKLRYRRLIGDL